MKRFLALLAQPFLWLYSWRAMFWSKAYTRYMLHIHPDGVETQEEHTPIIKRRVFLLRFPKRRNTNPDDPDYRAIKIGPEHGIPKMGEEWPQPYPSQLHLKLRATHFSIDPVDADTVRINIDYNWRHDYELEQSQPEAKPEEKPKGETLLGYPIVYAEIEDGQKPGEITFGDLSRCRKPLD